MGWRHAEQSELTDETLYRRATNPPKGVEETVFDIQQNDRLRKAIAELTEVQRKRPILYYEFGLTYKEIAKIEGCSHVAVMHSLERAKATIEKKYRISNKRGAF